MPRPAADLRQRLLDHGIQPSAQRLAVAAYVLATDEHPAADRVLEAVSATFPSLSRATVYNTLNLFVERGLLRAVVLEEGRTLYDAHTAPHHHFIDEVTGRIHDVPWDDLKVSGIEALADFDVHEHEVVLRGRRRSRRRSRGKTE